MRITFDNQTRNVDKTTTEYRSVSPAKEGRKSAYALDISGTVMDNTAYGLQGRTAEEVMQSAGQIDVALVRDYMTVMSNSMSEEDFAKLQKEGYCPTDTDIETVVTIVDKIKAEMAKGGAHIVGYTDTLGQDVLEEIAGSTAYANALNKSQQLTSLTDGQVSYMLDNDMQPTIDDLYKAQFSGADRGSRGSGAYYKADANGYLAKKATDTNFEDIKGQIEQILSQAGMELTDKTMRQATFLVEHTIPVTADNIHKLDMLQELVLPVSMDVAKEAIVAAVVEGKEPGEANLFDTATAYDKAVRIDAEIDEQLEAAKQEGNAGKYRRLQEVRLMMTVEANMKLLRSGFTIDTTEMEKLVDALKQLEQEQAQELFPNSENQAAEYSLYKETIQTKVQIQAMPAALLGSLRGPVLSQSLVDLSEQGKALQAKYQQAGESYETLMTAPRRDLGDRIQNAFRNVDDILKDMQLDLTEESRRAVRILGYNSMEITEGNIQTVMDADRDLQRVISKMTPPSVVKMIRDGVNPLKVTLEELEQYLDANASYEDEAEKYSKYLYKLEHSGEISEQEKASYIGIYRMLRQIEKTESASIGALLHSGAEITFGNILTSIRSGKAKGLDVKLDEQFGTLEELVKREASIPEQIEKAYVREQIQRMQEAAKTTEQDVQTLLDAEITVTVENLLAAKQIRTDSGDAFRKLKEKSSKLDKIPDALAQMDGWEDQLTDTLESTETYTEHLSQLKAVAEELTFTETDFLDVKAMQTVHKQLSIMAAKATAEEYHIPVVLDGELATLNLTLRHEEGKQGMVEITTQALEAGALNATFWMDGSEVSAFMVAQTTAGEIALRTVTDVMQDYLKEKGYQNPSIGVVQSQKAGMSTMAKTALDTTDSVATKDLYELARTYIKALKNTLR